MKRAMIAIAALGVLMAACSGTSGAGVATLDDSAALPEAAAESPEAPTDEEALLDFAQCMRDQGIEDFEDPEVNADGSLVFGFRGQGQVSEEDRETVRAAFQSCQEHLEGLAFGPGRFDRSEIEDTLYEFAACMRDPERGNLAGFPDPDFSNLEPGGGGGGGPFGGFLDIDDAAAQEALEACEEVFGGGLRFGGGARRGAGGTDGGSG